MQPIEFVREFIKYYETNGIYDEYDAEQNKMVTSKGITALYEMARDSIPEPIKPREAANRMRELNPLERDALIRRDEAKNVIDMRNIFARRMSENGGARGILNQLIEAKEEGDVERFAYLLKDAEGIIKGPENVNEEV